MEIKKIALLITVPIALSVVAIGSFYAGTTRSETKIQESLIASADEGLNTYAYNNGLEFVYKQTNSIVVSYTVGHDEKKPRYQVGVVLMKDQFGEWKPVLAQAYDVVKTK